MHPVFHQIQSILNVPFGTGTIIIQADLVFVPLMSYCLPFWHRNDTPRLQCSNANYWACLLLLRVVDFVFPQRPTSLRGSHSYIVYHCCNGRHTPTCDALVMSGCFATTLLRLLSGRHHRSEKNTLISAHWTTRWDIVCIVNTILEEFLFLCLQPILNCAH